MAMSADVAYTPRSLLAAVLGSLRGVILQQSPPALPAGAADHCRADPCQNGGQCRGHAEGYRCLCAAGWDGERCGHPIEPCEQAELSSCDSRPAYGEQLQASRALCKHVGPGMHTCDCQPGFACADGPPAGVCTGEVCVEVGEEAQTLRLSPSLTLGPTPPDLSPTHPLLILGSLYAHVVVVF